MVAALRREAKVGPVAIVGLLAAIAIAVPFLIGGSEADDGDVSGAAYALVAELNRTPATGNVDVRAALGRAVPASGEGKFRSDLVAELRLTYAGRDASGGEQHELTNSDGDHPYCVTVHDPGARASEGETLRATVATGSCPGH